MGRLIIAPCLLILLIDKINSYAEKQLVEDYKPFWVFWGMRKIPGGLEQ